jgi:hypothetical protein
MGASPGDIEEPTGRLDAFRRVRPSPPLINNPREDQGEDREE